MGGINESGLVVEHLFMPGTVYPEARGRKVLLEFEWIQYMLDICSEVSDLISSAQDVAIAGDRVPMHFLAVDRTGACALLEFREGQLELHRGNRFQPPVVTNDWYEDSLRYLETLTGGAGLESPPATSMQSLDRFARLALLLKELPPVDDLEIHERAMSMLDSVLDNTLLSVVYQPENGTVQYRSKGNPDRRRVRIADFDFSPTAKPLMLDIHLDTQAMEGFDVEAMRRCLASTLAIGRDFLKLDPYLDRMTD
jgi:penicillin V acylase-like amidase (Ntn superfamily)